MIIVLFINIVFILGHFQSIVDIQLRQTLKVFEPQPVRIADPWCKQKAGLGNSVALYSCIIVTCLLLPSY